MILRVNRTKSALKLTAAWVQLAQFPGALRDLQPVDARAFSLVGCCDQGACDSDVRPCLDCNDQCRKPKNLPGDKAVVAQQIEGRLIFQQGLNWV